MFIIKNEISKEQCLSKIKKNRSDIQIIISEKNIFSYKICLNFFTISLDMFNYLRHSFHWLLLPYLRSQSTSTFSADVSVNSCNFINQICCENFKKMYC